MNKKDIIYIMLLALCIGIVVWTKLTAPKVAFVKSAVVLREYLGMKEVAKMNEIKMSKWQANIDTLTLDFESAVNDYKENYSKLSDKEKIEEENYLKDKQSKLEQYKSVIEQKAEEETEKSTQGVLNQVNSYIEEYSKKNGYDVVLGLTLSGNILYGTESSDITQEIIDGLNKSYKGK